MAKLAWCVVWMVVCCSPLAAQLYPLNQQSPSGWSLTTSGGIRGYRFRAVTADMTVTRLGCWYPDSSTVAKYVTLWNFTTQQQLGQVLTVPGAGWCWTDLATPVQLAQNTEYVVSAFSPTGHYFNNGVPASWMPTTPIQYLDMRYLNSTSATKDSFPSGGLLTTSHHGVVDIGYTQGPTVTASATAGTAASVYSNAQGPGNAGFVAGQFSLANASPFGPSSFTEMVVRGAGTGNHATAYTQFSIWRESGTTAGYDAADILIGSGSFSGTPAQATIAVPGGEQSIPASGTRTYYLVARLAGTATPGQTFTFTLHDVTVGVGTAKGGVPTATMNGFTIQAPALVVSDTSAAAQGVAYAGGPPAVIQRLEIAYAAGPSSTLQSLTVTGSTTGGNLQTDVVSVALYRDVNSDGVLDAGDILVATAAGFNASGQAVLAATGPEATFTAPATRQFLVAAAFSVNTPNNAEFATQVTAGGAASGTLVNGLPAPTAGPAPGVQVSAADLRVTFHGPTVATNVDSDSLGPGGNGHVIWDGTLETAGLAWTVASLTFLGSGTANLAQAFTALTLFEDANANGIFEPGTDGAATPTATGFNASNQLTLALNNPAFNPAAARRFFLVAQLAGTATTGQTINAALSAMSATPPVGGQITGDMGVASTALIIDMASLTVFLGPASPGAHLHVAGTALSRVLMQVRLAAGNDTVSVSSLVLTTGGTGDWAANFPGADGVELWLDDGDGVFGATDTLLHAGPGGATVGGAFTGVVQVPVSGSRDIWVRGNSAAGAGIGEAVAITHTLRVDAPGDVGAGPVAVLFGVPAAQSAVLSMVEFFVTSISPTADNINGGRAITVQGSGLVTPFVVKIAGVVCPGTPVVTGGTTVTGLTVPAGAGTNLPIEVTNGPLAPITLAHTFSYSGVVNAAGGGGGGGGGCATGAAGGFAGLLMLLALRVRRRRVAR